MLSLTTISVKAAVLRNRTRIEPESNQASVYEASAIGYDRSKVEGWPKCGIIGAEGKARHRPAQQSSWVFPAPFADLGVPGLHPDARDDEGAPGAIFRI